MNDTFDTPERKRPAEARRDVQFLSGYVLMQDKEGYGGRKTACKYCKLLNSFFCITKKYK